MQIASASLTPPLVSAPEVVTLLLDIDPGAATLSTLRSLLRGGLHSGSCDRLLTQPHLLARLLEISGGGGRRAAPEDGPERGMAWEILILLLAHAVTAVPEGTGRFVGPLVSQLASQGGADGAHAPSAGSALIRLWLSLVKELTRAQRTCWAWVVEGSLGVFSKSSRDSLWS